ncbi:serine/threonine protein kinase [Martiniozyma asiatica (nom. inval.)]|nr:serine/threonine protein kinase [Martiniozyma asiatica]
MITGSFPRKRHRLSNGSTASATSGSYLHSQPQAPPHPVNGLFNKKQHFPSSQMLLNTEIIDLDSESEDYIFNKEDYSGAVTHLPSDNDDSALEFVDNTPPEFNQNVFSDSLSIANNDYSSPKNHEPKSRHFSLLMKSVKKLGGGGGGNSLSSTRLPIQKQRKRTQSLPQLPQSKMTYRPFLDRNSISMKIGEIKAAKIDHNLSMTSNYTYQLNQQAHRKMSFQDASGKSSSESNTFSSTSDSSVTSSYNEKFFKPLEKCDDEIPCDDNEGHYIVKIGSYFANDRFVIKELLGQGTFGKVIRAYDNYTKEEVAVKIIKSIHKYREASKIELRVLSMLKKHDPSNEYQCIHFRECFDYRNHICIVTDLLKMSLYDYMEKNSFLSFPGSHIQAFARQLLRSVAFMHDLNLIHTDLKPENILLRDESSVKRPFVKGNKQILRKILKDPSIYTIDFGSAIFDDEYHSSVVSTRHYRAPEIILGTGWSFPCDIWSIACILVELLTGEALYRTHENEQHLAMMEHVVNEPVDIKLIRQCLNLYGNKKKLNPNSRFDATIVNAFDRSNLVLNYPKSTTSTKHIRDVKQVKSLENIIGDKTNFNFTFNVSCEESMNINGIDNLQSDDYKFWWNFVDLLKGMMKWNPQKRLTAREALDHDWFRLGIMDDGILKN